MSIKCSVHRNSQAHFQCHKCGGAYCEKCVSIRSSTGYGEENRDYFCPTCNLPAEHVGVGNLITPFWERLPKFFTYPLQPVPLILTFFLSLLGALVPFSIFVQVFVWVVMMKYAYAVFLATGQGSFKAPTVTWQLINSDIEAVLKQFVIFGLIGFGAKFVFGTAGVFGGFLYLAFIAIFAPAILMVLVASNSVFNAINPLIFIPLVSRIGARYFLMYLFLFLLYSAPMAVFSYFPLEMPFQVWKFLILFFGQYYALVSYHLMGYVLLQYHEEIGYHVDYEHFMDHSVAVKGEKLDEQEKLLNSLGVLVQNGRYEDALVLIRSETRGKFTTVELSERYLQLLQMTGNQEEANRFRGKHLDLMVQHGKKEKSVQLYKQLELETGDTLSPETLFSIASWLNERSEFKKALNCYMSYIKDHKEHLNVPEAYFEVAQILHERGNNSKKAKQIMNILLSSFPDHKLIPEVKKYLAAMPL